MTAALFGLGLALLFPPRAAAQCPEQTISGSVDSGDGSTMPQKVQVFARSSSWGRDIYMGSFAQGPATITAGMGGDFDATLYGVHGFYFWSPIGGSLSCRRSSEPPYCSTCWGSFALSLYAMQGAIEGTLSVVPPPETGLAGLWVWAKPENGYYTGAMTDAAGRFEFRALAEPGRSNNWGLTVDGNYSPWPHSAEGSTVYFLGPGGVLEAQAQVKVTSSQLSTANLSLRNPLAQEPELRCEAGGAPNSVGNPVNVITGNVYFDQTDAVVGGVAGLRFTRSYNSRNAYRNVGSAFGRGFSHSYDKTVSALGSKSLTFRDGEGVPLHFHDADGDFSYEAALPATEESKIVKTPAGYTRIFREGGSEIFDASGHLTGIVDASGNTTTLTRDPQGRLLEITDPGGRSLTLAYDSFSRIALLSSPQGPLAAYTYDAGGFLQTVRYGDGSGYSFTADPAGQILRVEDATGRTVEAHTYDGSGHGLTSELGDGQERVTLSYDHSHQKTTVTDARGNATTYHWRSFGAFRRVTKVEGPCSSCGGGGSETQEWTYDGRGRVTSYKDGAGSVTAYVYDADGDLLSSTNPLGQTTSYTHDMQGRVLTVTAPDGAVTAYTHAPAGPLTVTDPINRTTSITYNPQGQPTGVTDPRSKVTALAHTSAGDLASVTDPMGHTTSFAYDAMGRRTKATDPLSHTTTTEYDARGRVTKVTAPDGKSTTFTYDAGGRRRSVTDALGRATQYGYDAYGRLETVTDPQDGVTAYSYDLMSNLTSLTDARGKATSFEYDGYGRVTEVTYPSGGSETFTYDLAGRLETKTDRQGIVTTYEYDPLGRLTRKSHSDGTPEVTFAYDAVGRVVSAANGTDSLAWSYDLAGQLLSEASTKNASAVAYTYDAGGNRLSLSLDGSLLLNYAYDDTGRLTQIRRGSSVFSFDYDLASRRRRLTYPNAVVTRYGYDAVSRLTTMLGGLGRSWDVTNLRYGYDGVGNRTARVTPGAATTYGYDLLSRLTGVTTNQTVTEAYGYDPVGNRLSSLTDPNWRYGESNELVSNTAASFAYDANGNLTSKTEAGDRWLYEWNADSQLVRVVKNVRQVTRFAYDPLGRRVEKIANVRRTRYLYDGEDILRERTGATTRTYVHGPGIDEPLAVEDTSAGVSYFHADAIGSVVATTDSRGQVTARYEYDSFGVPQQPQPGGHSYTAREWDPDVQMYYYRARWYEPRSGRFASEDPIRFDGGMNFYAYAWNSPATWTDPSGENPIIVICAIAAFFVLNNPSPANDPEGPNVIEPIIANETVALPPTMRATWTAGKIFLVPPRPRWGSSLGPGAYKRTSPRLRDKIRQRDNNQCVFCKDQTARTPGSKQSNIDHSDPRALGGDLTDRNLQNTCRACNLKKAMTTTLQYVWKLMWE